MGANASIIHCQPDIVLLYRKNISVELVKVEAVIAIIFSGYALISCYLAPSNKLDDQIQELSNLINTLSQ